MLSHSAPANSHHPRRVFAVPLLYIRLPVCLPCRRRRCGRRLLQPTGRKQNSQLRRHGETRQQHAAVTCLPRVLCTRCCHPASSAQPAAWSTALNSLRLSAASHPSWQPCRPAWLRLSAWHGLRWSWRHGKQRHASRCGQLSKQQPHHASSIALS